MGLKIGVIDFGEVYEFIGFFPKQKILFKKTVVSALPVDGGVDDERIEREKRETMALVWNPKGLRFGMLLLGVRDPTS